MTKPWIFFDADNTLWETTWLYRQATARVVAMIAARGHDPAAVQAWADAHDVSLAKVFGYSMHRFPRSLRDTAEHFLGDGEHAWAALGMGYSVFSETAEPYADAVAVLDQLAAEWNLGVVTAGEVTVQEKRLADFPASDRFALRRIVAKKTPDTFRALAAEIGRDPAACWMVGDSLRSDIIPAVTAGFNAIQILTDNWAAFEVDGHERPTSVPVVRALSEIPAIVARGPRRPA